MIFLPRCPICSDKMPEGPELHMASIYVNKMCSGVIFTGAVIKSEVSKSSDVPFTCEAYRITATSRGKEVKLTLTPVKSDEPTRRQKAGQADQPMDIVFRFGMSGFFKFTTEDELPKHAHLRFYSSEKPCRVLSFVDARRFGSWHPGGVWQPSRGPCVLTEYKGFRLAVPKLERHWFSWLTDITSLTRRCVLFFHRENVISHLSDHAFDRPICEVLLNQKYFNGIGNYLRAEILFRWLTQAVLDNSYIFRNLKKQQKWSKWVWNCCCKTVTQIIQFLTLFVASSQSFLELTLLHQVTIGEKWSEWLPSSEVTWCFIYTGIDWYLTSGLTLFISSNIQLEFGVPSASPSIKRKKTKSLQLKGRKKKMQVV